ncbi:MAG: hypothetical protein SGI73_04545 [Chloroflexota bacterium]|nr:hypothetical protein [Chloroflexota bacterium]
MWQRLYFHSKNESSAALTPTQIADALRDAVRAAGYTIYDPFGLMPGLSYPTAVKLFVTPDAHGNGTWHVIVASSDPVDDATITAASAALDTFALLLRLNADGTAAIQVWDNGVANNDFFTALTWESGRAAALQILAGDALTLERYAPPIDALSTPQVGAIPFDALPADIQSALASGKGISADAANKLFAKMSGIIGGKLDAQTASQAGAAQALLSANRIDWNTPGARQLRALCAVLNLPAPLDPPDFNTLREAYPLYARKRRKPDAPDYPGDAETMAAVPNALDYLPIYGGKR